MTNGLVTIRMSQVALIALLACSMGCKNDDSTGTDPSETTTNSTDTINPTTQEDCEQAWPIAVDGHQEDRIFEMYEGEPMMYWLPENPKAVFIIFHGNNQSIATLSTVEHEQFYNELASRNMGYYAFNGGQWDLSESPNNDDFLVAANFRDGLIADGVLTEDTPVFSAGFSGGCDYNPTFANIALNQGWDYRGFACHVGFTNRTAPVRSVFYANANDDPEDERGSHSDQLETGFTSILYDLPESPMTPDRFTKIVNIDATESQSWFDEMVEFGMIDENGVRLVAVEDMDAAINYFETNSTGQGNNRASAQIKVVWRRHIWTSDFACAELNFFEGLL